MSNEQFPQPEWPSLGRLIEALEATPHKDRVCAIGFSKPHSHRGSYDQCAFEPAADVTIQQMLDSARSALGSTYGGWKGGDYTMSEYSDTVVAIPGHVGEGLGPFMLHLMLRTAAVSVSLPEDGKQ